MAEVLLSSDDLTVLGGPAEVSVDVDFGPQGDRGSIILYGLGKPNDVTLPVIPQIYDTYINLLVSDDEYLFMYQYIAGPGGVPEWTRLTKLIPDSYVENVARTFSATGEIDINVPLSAIINYELVGSYTAEDFNIQCSVLNLNPISLAITVGDLVSVSGIQSLPISIKAIEYSDSEWVPLVGLKTVHLSITVV
jgi:hypothetical protein